MTSLDAFKIIIERIGKGESLEGTYNEFLLIKKDLEVLELLKYFIQVEYEKADDTYWVKLGKYGGTLTNKETYEKIKNWLERKE